MSKSEDLSGFEAVMMLAMIPASFVMEAWLISLGWAWFAVPLGIRAISGWHAFGISAMHNLFVPLNTATEDMSARRAVGRLIGRFAWAGILGYIAHRMMS